MTKGGISDRYLWGSQAISASFKICIFVIKIFSTEENVLAPSKVQRKLEISKMF